MICLYYLNCTKFVQLILRKIVKLLLPDVKILRLKCTKFDFRRKEWGEGMAGGGKGREREKKRKDEKK